MCAVRLTLRDDAGKDADAGLSYYYLMNDNLLHAGTILSGNTNRSFFQGSVGIGVNFWSR